MTSTLAGAAGYSPFHEYWASRSLTNAWSQIGPLTLPIEVSGAREEKLAFGSSAAFADLSNRAVATVSGLDTQAFLAVLSGSPADAFAGGASRSILWCDANGFVRGSGRLAMRATDEAVLISEVSDLLWLSKAAKHFGVRVERSAAAGLRLAGPQCAAVLRKCGTQSGPKCELIFPGIGSVLAAPPHEEAVDLWVEPENALGLAWALERAGAFPSGLKALNAWRIANGLLSAPADWTPEQWCATTGARRTRQQLSGGGYAVAAWSKPPPPDVTGAVSWPALGQHVAIVWAPTPPGRPSSAPGGGVIWGPAATD